jgi:Flp pilus assembly protein TadG
MLQSPSRKARRRAMTLVETALVLPTFLLFLLGIFEYARFIMLQSVLVNATREGCRYALCHSQDTTVVADVKTQVLSRMAGMDGQLSGFTIWCS